MRSIAWSAGGKALATSGADTVILWPFAGKDGPMGKEPAMLAPVLAQPSLPLKEPAGLEITPEEIKAVRERLERDDLTVLAYRFKGDRFCRAERFAAYAAALGNALPCYFETTREAGVIAHPMFPVCFEWPLIVGMRRGTVNTGAWEDSFGTKLFLTMERNGNSLGMAAGERMKFIEKNELPIYDGSQEYCLWLGCMGAYDPAGRETILALVKVLRYLGITFGVLRKEKCNGDPARRLGNDLLFTTLAEENAEGSSIHDRERPGDGH